MNYYIYIYVYVYIYYELLFKIEILSLKIVLKSDKLLNIFNLYLKKYILKQKIIKTKIL